MKKIFSWQNLCVWLLFGFLGVFLLLPVLVVIGEGLNYRILNTALTNRVYLEGITNSLAIAVVTTILVLIISLPLALIFDRFEFPGKRYCNFAILIPMILPPFVGALGFQQILGHYGVINMALIKLGLPAVDFLGGAGKFWAICAIEALHLYPIMYLNLVTALGNIDPAYREAGMNLGASRLYRFRHLTLPLLKPGIFAGGSLVLIWSFTELGTPLMFGYYRAMPVQIYNGLTELSTTPVPFALVALMLVISSLLYYFGKVVLGGNVSGNTGKGAAGSVAFPLAGSKKFLPAAAFAIVGLIAATPHLALLLLAFFRDWYMRVLPQHFTMVNFENALSHQLVIPSIINSLKYSVCAMLIALMVGLLISLAAKRWRVRGGGALDLLSMLPLAVPGIVIAFGFLGMSIKFAWARTLFSPEENPLLLLAVAYAVRRLPYVVRSVSSGLDQTPVELENAARNLGASGFRTFWKVTLPLIGANLVVGGLFAFSFSMLEVSDSLILAQKSVHFPITKAIFELSQILGSGPFTASAFGVWTMAFLAATLLGATLLLGKKIGAIFKL